MTEKERHKRYIKAVPDSRYPASIAWYKRFAYVEGSEDYKRNAILSLQEYVNDLFSNPNLKPGLEKAIEILKQI